MKETNMMRRARLTMAAAACLIALTVSSRSEAAVTVSVEVAYGTAVAGGVGFFMYVAATMELPLAIRELPSSLVEVRDGAVRLGVPVPFMSPCSDAVAGADADMAGDQSDRGVQVDVVRWRF